MGVSNWQRKLQSLADKAFQGLLGNAAYALLSFLFGATLSFWGAVYRAAIKAEQQGGPHRHLAFVESLVLTMPAWLYFLLLIIGSLSLFVVGMTLTKYLSRKLGAEASQRRAAKPALGSELSVNQILLCQELEHIAALFRQTKSLEVKTQCFLNEMEDDLPRPGKIALNDASAEFLRFLDQYRARYDEELEPDLIKLTITLRTQYGIMPVGLTDGAILNESILPQSVEAIKRGLSDAADKLLDLLARKASQL